MARQKQKPGVGLLPILLCCSAFILVLFVLLGGANKTLSQIYYLKTDLSGLSIPSKLQSSTFLQDLSEIADVDYVGGVSTAASLGLADFYTISLLSSCGHFAGGTVECAKLRLGFSFQPVSDFHLDGTSLGGTYPAEFVSTLQSYARMNRFLMFAYIGSALLIFLSPIFALCSAGLAIVGSTLATCLLFAAGIAATVVFNRVNAVFNNTFSTNGMHSSLGVVPLVLGWVAFVLALVVAASFIARARRNPAAVRRRGVVAHSVGGKDAARLLGGQEGAEAEDGTGVGSGSDAKEKKPGLWGRIPTFSQHRYVQVEKQPTVVRTDVMGHQEALVLNSPEGVRQRLDEDWAAQDEYSHGAERHSAVSTAFPTVTIGGNKPTKDLNTAYEPYSGPSS